jgi:hypothetical protein
VYKVPSLNCGHCLVNPNRFGVDIAHFVVVGRTRLSVFWCGACFGAGVRLVGIGENGGSLAITPQSAVSKTFGMFLDRLRLNARSEPVWSARSAAWLAGSAAVPALGLSKVENSRFEAQLPFSQSKSVFSMLACLPSRQRRRQRGKIVATVHAKRTSGHFLRVSTGFYGLP